MTKFTINAKNLKAMMDKAILTINKASAIPVLRTIRFSAEGNGALKLYCTSIDHCIEVRTNDVWDVTGGVFGIYAEDAKIIEKMTGVLTVEEMETEVNIHCGKKIVSIHKCSDIANIPELPEIYEKKDYILTVRENWLLETVVNLNRFLGTGTNVSKVFAAFHFNTIQNRVEALDGYKVGTRTLNEQTIHITANSLMDTVKLHGMCVPVFKKVLDKKSEKEIHITQDEKYVKVEGTDFTYMTRTVEGEYFNVEQVLQTSATCFNFTVNRDAMLEIMKYDMDLIKSTGKKVKSPVVLHMCPEGVYSYLDTGKYKSFDVIETKDNTASEDFYMGINPEYFSDVLSVLDVGSAICQVTDRLGSVIIHGNEFQFFVLPIRMKEKTLADAKENMKKYIEKGRVA